MSKVRKHGGFRVQGLGPLIGTLLNYRGFPGALQATCGIRCNTGFFILIVDLKLKVVLVLN